MSIPSPTSSSLPRRLLNFILPTPERSYLSALKNKFSNNRVAASFVGGSPGRIILYISASASKFVAVVSALRVSEIYGPDSSSLIYKTLISFIFASSKAAKKSSSIKELHANKTSPEVSSI